MTGKEIAATLREALALMNNSGAHWIKGSSRREISGGVVAYCSIGAIRKVVFGDPYGDSDGDHSPEFPVTETLAAVIGNGSREEDAGALIVEWNDADPRTWSDIEKAFAKAAEKAEAEA